MKPIPFEEGRVVKSIQGRDSGRCFMVMSVVNDAFVLIADGELRKVEKPKRKKMMHLHAKPYCFPELAMKLKSGAAVQNSELRKALKEALMNQDLPPCKEGCVLVQK